MRSHFLRRVWVALDQEKCESPETFPLPAPYTWQREAPCCAICRASLSVDAPMIPNFAVDNAVEKHVEALGSSGIEGWESAGTKFKEWQARKE